MANKMVSVVSLVVMVAVVGIVQADLGPYGIAGPNHIGGHGGHGIGLGGHGHGGHGHEHYAPIPYDFGYGVADHYTGTDFGHTENSDGNGAVKGTYYVLLPDGRKQIVTYTADHYNGYQAHVSYEGTAHYPDVGHAAPGYHG